MIILNNLVNTGQRMEQEKNTDIHERQQTKDSTLFFYMSNFKRTMRFTGK